MNGRSLLSKAVAAARLVTFLRIAVGILSLGSQVVLARLLLPEAFGKLAFLMVVVDLVGRLASAQSEQGIIRSTGDGDETVHAYFCFDGILALAATIGLIAAGPGLMSWLGRPDLGFPLQVAAAMLVTRWLRLPLTLAKKELEFRSVVRISLIGETIKPVVSIALALYGVGFWALLAGALAGAASQSVLIWIGIPYRPKWVLDKGRIREMLAFSLPLTASGFLSLWYWRVDDLMVGRMLGEEQLGYYWMAFRIPHALLAYVENLDRVTYPAFAKAGSDETLHAGFDRVTHLSAVVLLFPAVVSLIWAREIIVQVFGSRWEPAVVPFQMFTCLIVFRGTFRHWANVAILKGRTDIFLKVVTLSAVLVTGLVYLLTPRFGIVGTAAGVAAAMVLVSPTYLISFKRLFPTPYARILARPVTGSVLVLSAGWLLKAWGWSASSPVGLAGHLVLMSGLYMGLLALIDPDAVRFVKAHILKTELPD